MKSRTYGPMRVVHLPFYGENPYQPMIMTALRDLGVDAIEGGAGGNFFRTAFRKWKPDVLHFHWLHPYLLKGTFATSLLRSSRFLAEVYLLRQRSQIAWTVHNLHNHANRFLGIERFFTSRFARMCDNIFAHGPCVLNTIRKQFSIPSSVTIQIVNHPTYRGYYPDHIARASARQSLGLTEDQFVVVSLGRISEYKGLALLIRSFLKIAPKNAVLLIAGSCNSSEYLHQLKELTHSEPRIRLSPSRVPDHEIQVYLRSADLFAVTHTEILTSGSAILGLSFDLPVLAPNLGDLRYALGDAAFLYRANDENDLESTLKSAIFDVSLRHSKQQAASYLANSNAPSEIAQQLVHFYSGERKAH